MINKQRMEPLVDEPFIVFIVGFRINNYWKLHKWLPVVRAFKRMLKELDRHPDIGCMGYEYWVAVDGPSDARTCRVAVAVQSRTPPAFP